MMIEKNGLSLWKRSDNNFTVIVYQSSDPNPYTGLDPKEYTLIELRVISSSTPYDKFWDINTKRVTHKKRNWFLACMNPKKSKADCQKDLMGTGFYIKSQPQVNLWFDFDAYEEEISKMEEYAEETFSELSSLQKKFNVPAKAEYRALKTKDNEKFWVIALYPDYPYWIIRIDHGLVKNFGKIYPSYWETGFRFADLKKASKFFLTKIQQQLNDPDYIVDTTDTTMKMMKWSLKEVMEFDQKS